VIGKTWQKACVNGLISANNQQVCAASFVQRLELKHPLCEFLRIRFWRWVAALFKQSLRITRKVFRFISPQHLFGVRLTLVDTTVHLQVGIVENPVFEHHVDYLRQFGAAWPAITECQLVLHTIKAHENGVSQLHIVFDVIICEVGCCCHAVFVRLFD